MSLTSIALIMIVALILFGPEDLPVIARTLGKMVYQVRKLLNEITNEFREVLDTPGNAINEMLKDNPAKQNIVPEKKAEDTEELLSYEEETKISTKPDSSADTNPLADLPSELISYPKEKQAGE